MSTQIQNITKQNILSTIKANQTKLQAFGVKKVGLFGSFVRNEQTENSDIDFLVEFTPQQKTFDNFIQLSFLLEELLSHPVEVITPESLSPYIRPYIVKEVEYVSFST